MFGFKKLPCPRPARRCPAAPRRFRTAETHFVNHRALKGPYPEGTEKAMFGLGCFWGAERKFWELGVGIHVTAVGYAGGLTPNPTYEEVCSRPHRPQRSGAGGLRSEEGHLRAAAQDVLGGPRPDPGHAPGQRRRHAVPLRHLHLHAAQKQGGRGLEGDVRAGAEDEGLSARSPPRSSAPEFYFAEDYHQQYLAKNPDGYCGLGGTGVTCPIGTGAKLSQGATA